MRLLVTVAHPDDETFGCGSVLAHAAATGVESFVACATRGERGELSGRVAADAAERARVGAIREAELHVAAGLLGVARVELPGWEDSGVNGDPPPGSLAAAGSDAVEGAIAQIVNDVRPDVVVTLDASDGHRDHAVIRDATLAAVARTAWRPARVYLWCLPRSLLSAFTGRQDVGTPDDAITCVVDTSGYVDQRWRAMRAHASQPPPYDAMAAPLRHEFLRADRLRRVRPPWTGGPLETDWRP